jgi:glycosyltransferase involved in cell wall biosynthesis
MPKVSIIVPSYNYAKYMDERIQSLLNQTYQDFELIIVDDASTDNSVDVINKYKYDTRIKTQFFSENSGLPYKRWNDGAKMSCGDYLLFAGADDACAPTMLEKLTQSLDAHPNVGIAYCQSMKMDAKSNLIHSLKKYTNTLDKKRWSHDYLDTGENECCYMVIKNTIPNASAALMRRSLFEKLGGFDENLRLVADWMLWSKILLESDVAFIAEPLNYFRYHSGTVRSTMYKVGSHTKEWYEYIAAMEKETNIPTEYLQRAYDRVSYSWGNSILRLLVTHPKKAVEQASAVYKIASRFDPKLNNRLLSRIIKDIASLGTVTIRNRLMWR